MSIKKALLIDITKCVGCRACVSGCREQHGQPLEQVRGWHARPASGGADTATLTATSWTVIEERGDKFVRRL